MEQRDISKAESYTKRYEIWLAVHSLMLREQEIRAELEQTSAFAADDEVADAREREERVRVATLSALFAAREVQLTAEPVAAEVE